MNPFEIPVADEQLAADQPFTFGEIEQRGHALGCVTLCHMIAACVESGRISAEQADAIMSRFENGGPIDEFDERFFSRHMDDLAQAIVEELRKP